MVWLIIYLNTARRIHLRLAYASTALLLVLVVAEQFYIPAHHPNIGSGVSFGQTVDYGVYVCTAGAFIAVYGMRRLLIEHRATKPGPNESVLAS